MEDNEVRTITVSNSCLKKASEDRNINSNSNSNSKGSDDDERVIQLLPDSDSKTFPLLNVRCSNEYMIVDVERDTGWKSYFTSHRLYHYAVMGPVKDDHSNWQEWLLPSMTDFLVSPDCRTCSEEHELQQNYGQHSAYYMTSALAGCPQFPGARVACDMDFYSYECRVCAFPDGNGYPTVAVPYNGRNGANVDVLHFFNEVEEYAQWLYGACAFTIRDAYAQHSAYVDDFTHCKHFTFMDSKSEEMLPRRKPSLGIDGRFCMCVKSNAVEEYKEYKVQFSEEKEETAETDAETDAEKGNDIFLFAVDFELGTYRIRSPGTYVLMEDIVFDFRAPKGYKHGNLKTYNDEYAWWPTSADAEAYPGAGDTKDPYFLGFYAGIVIECNDVILELNGHKLSMSEAFFYQQAFFALIALTSQPFLPGQGAGFFGANPISANNTVIKNGELGLSSHHGIQGYFNEHLLIENVNISQFKTHGIQLNGFKHVHMKNIDIGYNRVVDRLSPYYAQLRHYLPTYQRVAKTDEAKDRCLTFDGRDKCVTLQELADDAQVLLDMAFETAYFGQDWDEIFSDASAFTSYTKQMQLSFDELLRRQKLWEENGAVFLNTENIYPQTASLYGIFLNYVGSSVIGWYAGSDAVASSDVTLENVHIHDLTHNTFENIGFSKQVFNCLNAPFNAYHLFGQSQVNDIAYCNNILGIDVCGQKDSDLHYIGNLFTDIQLLHIKLITDYGLTWDSCFAGASDIHSLVEFAFDSKSNMFFGLSIPILKATHDPMIHPGKGVIALRLNGVEHVTLSDIRIENIWSATRKGSTVAGKYLVDGAQQSPYLLAYSMNHCTGLVLTFVRDVVFDDIVIDHLQSDTGRTYAISVWFQTDIEVAADSVVSISNIVAGAQTFESDYDWEDEDQNLPNLIPEACAIRMYGDETYAPVMRFADADADADDMKNNYINISCVTGLRGCMETYEYSMVGEVRSCENNIKKNDILFGAHVQSVPFGSNSGGYSTTVKNAIFYFLCALMVVLFLILVIVIVIVTKVVYNCCHRKRRYDNHAHSVPLRSIVNQSQSYS